MSVRKISEELQAKAVKELNEEPKRIPDDIKFIKTWLNQNKYISARTDDQWILNFLRGCKFSLERTKEKLEFYYTIRTLLPEFFKNRNPFQPEIQKILEYGISLPLPHTEEPDSPRICLIRGGHFDATSVDQLTLMKVNMMIQDILVYEDDHYLISGNYLIQDMQGVTMAHMPPPSLAKKAMTVWQDGYPVRPKGLHFLNTPSFFETIFGLFRPFIKEKMKNRISVHSSKDLSEFYKVVPQKLLPKEYGGDGPTLQELTDFWKKKVESYKDWFLEEEKFGTDEKKRPGKPKTSDELFGIEGSFRKLNVD